MKHEQSITVPFNFPIVFTRDLFGIDNAELLDVLQGEPAKIMVVIDEGVVKKNAGLPEKINAWVSRAGGRVALAGQVHFVPGGEQIKNSLEEIDRLLAVFQRYHLCRHCYVLMIGGGAVLDAVGFAASIAHRGLRQVRIPTTVLSQNDSGVGVKNGVNRFGVKNFLGTFVPPDAVLNDSLFLETLTRRDWIAGVAEAFKVGIIKDRSFVVYLKQVAGKLKDRDMPVMEEVIRRCAFLHCSHIATSQDPFERESFRPLDFGHWAAHRIESMSRNRLRHGEAVAIGMALDLFSAWQLDLVIESEVQMAVKAMQECGLPVWDDLLLERDKQGQLKILDGMQEFREHLGGELSLTMPNGLGNMIDVHELAERVILHSLEELQTLEQASGEVA